MGSSITLLAAGAIAAGCGSPGSTPTSTSAGLVGIVSRGSIGLQIDNTAGSNVASSHIAANEVTVTFRDTPSSNTALYAAGFEDKGGGSYTKQWDLSLALIGDVTQGAVFQVVVGGPTAAGMAASSYQDDVGGWSASSGTVTVTAVSGRKVTFMLDAITMDAGPAGPPGTLYAMGSFSLTGALTINDIDAVCDCIN